MEVSEEMLDVIEAVKGKRNPSLWDRRCELYVKRQKKAVKTPKKAVKTTSNS